METMQRIGLRETLEALRKELSEAILVSEGKQVRFEVGEIELEFQIAVEKTADGKGGINVWVLELGGSASEKNVTMHRVKIPLKPVWKDGKPILTGGDDIPS
ncbi:MAG: hypothetical protein NZ772_10420 [Cyanobacteria bacterium]|nr:hypothetical protein [Cyanobacteriota bacterium]MDW8199660.1 trypco2 family protein [Cyanobacteriota bacterium SKYGB_h_bin112]